MMTQKNTQTGRSMIEMLGVLAIIGVLSVGGIAGYSKAMMKFKVNRTVDELAQITTNIRTLFGGQRNYEKLTADVVNGAKLVPDEMRTSSSASSMTYRNPWSEDLTITVADKTKKDDKKAFIIKTVNVPTEACIELASVDWGSTSGSGFVAIGIGADNNLSALYTTDACNTAAKDGSVVACAHSTAETNMIPLAPDAAVKACAIAGALQTIYWKFY